MCPIRSGRILFELWGVSAFISKKAFRRAASKLPFKTKMVRLIF